MEAALPVVSEPLTANALAPDSENCFNTRASGARRCDTEPSEACPELTPGDCSFSFAYAADNPTLYTRQSMDSLLTVIQSQLAGDSFFHHLVDNHFAGT